MKKIILSFSLVLFAFNMFGYVTILYYNKDSKEQVMKVTMDGNHSEVKFSASTTSSVTIQGGGTKCTIETSCGKVEVKDGANIEIKDGCIKIN